MRGLFGDGQQSFRSGKFHIGIFEDAIADPERYFGGLFAFLGLDADATVKLIRAPVNKGKESAPPAALVSWLDNIHADRRQGLLRYVKEAFDLAANWPSQPGAPASGNGAMSLPRLPAVVLARGRFWESEEFHNVQTAGKTQTLGSALFIGDLLRRRDPSLFPAETKLFERGLAVEDLRLIHELDQHVPHLASVQLIEPYNDFNLVRFGIRLVAARRNLGAISWSEGFESLQGRLAPRDFFAAPTIAELKLQIDGMLAEEPVELVETYLDFNIARVGSRLVAVRKSLGPIDWREGYERLCERFPPTDFLSAASEAELKEYVDRINS